MNRAAAERASRIVQLAQIIQDTEGLDPNRAYDEAETLIDTPTVGDWLTQQSPATGTLIIARVRCNLVLRRGGSFFMIRADELPALTHALHQAD